MKGLSKTKLKEKAPLAVFSVTPSKQYPLLSAVLQVGNSIHTTRSASKHTLGCMHAKQVGNVSRTTRSASKQTLGRCMHVKQDDSNRDQLWHASI